MAAIVPLEFQRGVFVIAFCQKGGSGADLREAGEQFARTYGIDDPEIEVTDLAPASWENDKPGMVVVRRRSSR